MTATRPELHRARWLLPAAALVLWSLVFWRNAWICDDAYITFRCVEQLHAGHGPQWNPHARVQAFTHPLWFLLLSAVRVVSGAVWWNALALSFALATAALVWVGRRLCERPSGRDVSLALLLAMALGSKAFVDYAGGGLENALVFALLAAFLAMLERSGRAGADVGDLIRLTAVGALLLLSRHDLLFIVAPPIAAVAWSLRRAGLKRLALALLVGGSPFLLWTVFSVIYYGFPFPNTAYAKLSHGVDALRMWRQGLWYFSNALRWDPLTFIVAVVGPLFVLRSKRPAMIALAAGCWLHLFYVAKVGGDFMAGRFLTPVFFIGMAAIALDAPTWRRPAQLAACAAATLLAVGLPGARLFVDAGAGIESYYSIDASEHGIADEKRVWTGRGAFNTVERQLQAKSWNFHGAKARSQGVPVVHTAVGWDGFNAGVETKIIDVYALADPLLARLPAQRPWRIGHFSRSIPTGYTESVATGENRIRNPEIARLYESVRLVTEGPIWSGRRWSALVDLNFFYRRPACEEPPCRDLRARLLDPSVREPTFAEGAGVLEEFRLELGSPGETAAGEPAGAPDAGPAQLTLTGWLPDVEAEVVWIAGVPIKDPTLLNAAHPEIHRRSERRIGLMAGFVIRASFPSAEQARAAAATSCLIVREKPRGRPGPWRLVPRADGGCSELALRDAAP
ncbi:MAG: hypothetical protein AAGM22_17555 [Acidobacteriota bacterium]